MTTKTKSKPKTKARLEISLGYRYNIKRRLAELSPKSKQQVIIFVCSTCSVDYDTVNRYINERQGANKRNDVRILQAFAKKFKCNIDELINNN